MDSHIEPAELACVADETFAMVDEAASANEGDGQIPESYRSWFFAAVEPDTNVFLHVGLYPTRTTMATKLFLKELKEKHAIEEAEFFVDGAPWLQAGLFELGMHFRHETHGNRNPVERAFQEIKRRTEQFYTNYPNADPETVESWLCALAWAENHLI